MSNAVQTAPYDLNTIVTSTNNSASGPGRRSAPTTPTATTRVRSTPPTTTSSRPRTAATSSARRCSTRSTPARPPRRLRRDQRRACLGGDGPLAADDGRAHRWRHSRAAGQLSRRGWLLRRRPDLFLEREDRLSKANRLQQRGRVRRRQQPLRRARGWNLPRRREDRLQGKRDQGRPHEREACAKRNDHSQAMSFFGQSFRRPRRLTKESLSASRPEP